MSKPDVNSTTPNVKIETNNAIDAIPGTDKPTVAFSEVITQPNHEKQEYIEKYASEKMKKWDTDNPEPNSEAGPDKYNEWCKDRVEAKTKAQENGNVNAELKEWEKDNPKPNKEKDPQAFDKWVEDRSKQELELRKKQEEQKEERKSENKKENDKKEEEKKKETEELTEAEILQKAIKLFKLRNTKKRLEDGMSYNTVREYLFCYEKSFNHYNITWISYIAYSGKRN